MRLLKPWKRVVARVERELMFFGSWFLLLDVLAGLAACFVPLVSPLLGIARLGALAILVPALLRTLAIRHAEESDSELVKAIAIAFGLAAAYVAVRTFFVVEVCS